MKTNRAFLICTIIVSIFFLVWLWMTFAYPTIYLESHTNGFCEKSWNIFDGYEFLCTTGVGTLRFVFGFYGFLILGGFSCIPITIYISMRGKIKNQIYNEEKVLEEITK